MSRIYRLEVVPGNGIYNMSIYERFHPEHDSTYRKILDIRQFMTDFFGNDSERHPGPYADTLLCENLMRGHVDWTKLNKIIEKHFFGFVSIEQFRMWFYNDDFLRKLAEFGVTLVCYKVDALVLGNAQCVALMHNKKPENEVFRIPIEKYVESGIPLDIL